MPYASVTWGEMKANLADRLADPTMAFWTATELGVYLTEALRVWGLATNYWRERGTFNTVANTAFYPLQSTAGLTGLLGFTVTDRDIFQAIQYSLLESAAAQDNTWTPTEMYSIGQVTGSLNDMRDRFLTETGVVLARSTQAMPAPPIGRVSLSDHIIDVRRAAWIRADTGAYVVLWREDEWAEASYNSLYESSPTIPYAYTVAGTKPVELLVAPPPSIAATLELITTNAGATLDPANAATALGIPDNMSPAIKWAVIADLLKGDGQETDPIRMAAAERRWAEMIELAKMSSTIVAAIVNGSSVLPVTLFDLDAAYGGWETTPGTPADLALCGYNLAAINPRPDGVYGVTVDVIRNAPIPANDAAFIQVGLEETTTIIDYAEYAALFKVGGDELVRAEQRIKDFYEAASEYNSKLKANARFAGMFKHARREEDERPRELEGTNAGSRNAGSE